MGVKHVAVVCVAAAVCVGYFGYRHASRTSELRTRQEDNDSRLVQMTLKSPRAGLAEMGSALKRYHADHNAYPDSLASLYPDYISSQPFIHEVQWAYQPGTAGFHLEKSIVRGDQTLVAIIDADLKTRIIGSPHGNHDQRLASAAVDTGRSAREGADGASGSSYEHVKMAIRDADGKSSPEPGPASVAALRFEPVTVSVDPEGGELNGVVAGEVRKTFLVWRDAQGNLGFGNRQYPHAERLGIAAPDSWLILERRPFVGTNPGKAGGWIPDGTATDPKT